MAYIKAIIGLGNPGPKFASTRHNIGFLVIDALANKHDASFKKHGVMEVAEIQVNEKPVLLVKPQTYMNKVGEVFPLLRNKNIRPENVLAVHDELEKPFCSLTLREEGSHKGHNGLRSLIQHMGTPNFLRLGFGIGRPESREPNVVGDYVLSSFSLAEKQQLPDCVDRAITKILEIIKKEHPGGRLD